MKTVGDLMSRNVATVDAESSVAVAVGIMKERGIGAIVVAEGKKARGIFTERDIINRVFQASGGCRWEELKVKDFMSSSLVTTKPSQLGIELVETMRNAKIRHVPVIENDEVVGILSIRDLMSYYIERLGEVTEGLLRTTATQNYAEDICRQLEKSHEDLKSASIQAAQVEIKKALCALGANLSTGLAASLAAVASICHEIDAGVKSGKCDSERIRTQVADIEGYTKRISEAINRLISFSA